MKEAILLNGGTQCRKTLCIAQGLTLSVLKLFVKQKQPDVKLVGRE